jgi:hypothetical protein
MSALGALLAIVLLFTAFALLIARTDGLTFLGPARTRALAGAAAAFCRGPCRSDEGRCPLTGMTEPTESCPLHRFVAADQATVPHGSPFAVPIA